jgi:hypothetical protein
VLATLQKPMGRQISICRRFTACQRCSLRTPIPFESVSYRSALAVKPPSGTRRLIPGGLFREPRFIQGTKRKTLPVWDENGRQIGNIDEKGIHYYPSIGFIDV